MRYLSIILFLTISMCAIGQDYKQWEERFDEKSQKNLLVGACDLEEAAKLSDYTWLSKGATAYIPDTQAIKALKALLRGYRIIAVGGTWCGDTKELMPKFYRIMQGVQLDSASLEVYWLDRSKKGLYAESELYQIEYLPTFIIYKGREEIGRIVETLNKPTLEQELISILEKR